MTLTTTDEADIHDALAVLCECVHPMSWGTEPCDEAATVEAAVDDHTILLCWECLEGRRDQDLESFGAVRFTFREL